MGITYANVLEFVNNNWKHPQHAAPEQLCNTRTTRKVEMI
jgi:hypothetical protein